MPTARDRDELLGALRELPDAMRAVFARRPAIAAAAQRHAPCRRSWAVVGNGVNRVAAHELRIKLSELCYKSIACDVTEDKKHIDLSSEPLILVCAAGLHGSNADDVAKEVAIYRAHKAAPIVIADDDETRFATASVETISVPAVHPTLAFVLSRDGRSPVRLRGGARDRRVGPPAARGARLHRGADRRRGRSTPATTLIARRRSPAELEPLAARFFDGLRAGDYDGALEAGTAVRLASLLRYAIGVRPARRVPDRVRQGRHAEHASWKTSPPRSPRRSRS